MTVVSEPFLNCRSWVGWFSFHIGLVCTSFGNGKNCTSFGVGVKIAPVLGLIYWAISSTLSWERSVQKWLTGQILFKYNLHRAIIVLPRFADTEIAYKKKNSSWCFVEYLIRDIEMDTFKGMSVKRQNWNISRVNSVTNSEKEKTRENIFIQVFRHVPVWFH